MNKNRGFALSELLVAVFIFALIFAIIISLVRMSSGNVQSAKERKLTKNFKSAFETLTQKVQGANEYRYVTIPGEAKYFMGFDVIDPTAAKKLPIRETITKKEYQIITASKNGAGSTTCSLYGRGVDAGVGYLYVKQMDCTSPDDFPYTTLNSQPEQRLTSTKEINVTEFQTQGSSKCVPCAGFHTPHFLNISAKANDIENTSSTITLTTSIALDFESLMGIFQEKPEFE